MSEKKGANKMKIDWKKKLTSRKFWVSVAGFVSMLIVACGFAEETATQISAIIMSGASVIGYAIGEGLADSNKGNKEESGSDEKSGEE